eukprot:s1599_g3.t1
MHLVSKLLWWLPLGLTCRDFHNSCAAWAEHGECQQNPSYMKVQCALACNSCDWFSSRCLSRESTQGITAEVANRALRNAAAGDVPGVRVLTDHSSGGPDLDDLHQIHWRIRSFWPLTTFSTPRRLLLSSTTLPLHHYLAR